MYVQPEIIILFYLISFLVYTMPTILVNFSKSLRGKFLLLLLTVVVTLYNKTGGILMAMWLIFLSEFNYEMNSGIVYEGFTGTSTQQDIIFDNLRPINKKYEKNKQPDLLTIEEALKPVNSDSAVVI